MTDSTDLPADPTSQRHIYKLLAGGAVLLIATGTIVFSLLEGWSIIDALYFSVVTVTTVGFGDITPDTDAAKLFTVVYILFGISIIGTFLDARFKKRTYEREQRVRHNESGSA